ncbi:MAG: hypothetical protein ABI876_18925, partial [Bacteroidota bacterium]
MKTLHRYDFLVRSLLTASVLLLPPAIVSAQGQRPELGYTCEVARYIENLSPSAPAQQRNFEHGLLIEEVLVSELYPFSTTLFFDRG